MTSPRRERVTVSSEVYTTCPDCGKFRQVLVSVDGGAEMCVFCAIESARAEGARQERERIRARPLSGAALRCVRRVALSDRNEGDTSYGWSALLAAITEEP